MKASHKPIAREALQIVERGDELLLRLTGLPHAIELNRTAAEVWRCCNGTHTVAEIAELVADKFPDHEENVRNDIASCLRQLEEVGAIENSRFGPQILGRLTRLKQVSSALKNKGLGYFNAAQNRWERKLIYLSSGVKTACFICGCGHSGTTLMANILASHPKIYVPLVETYTFGGNSIGQTLATGACYVRQKVQKNGYSSKNRRPISGKPI